VTTHYSGPLEGSKQAGGGGLAGLPIGPLSAMDMSVVMDVDFNKAGDYDNVVDWTVTAITAGTAGIVTGASGILAPGNLRLDAPAQDQGLILQYNTALVPGAASASAVTSEIIFWARFALRDADASDCFVGLAQLNALSAVLTSAGALTSDCHAGFHCTNADNGVLRISTAGATAASATKTESIYTLSDDEKIDVCVHVTGTGAAAFYFRASGVASDSMRNPTAWKLAGRLAPEASYSTPFLPTIALVGDAAGDDLDLDRVVCAVKRDLTV
jgi:hypothetical protein